MDDVVLRLLLICKERVVVEVGVILSARRSMWSPGGSKVQPNEVVVSDGIITGRRCWSVM